MTGEQVMTISVAIILPITALIYSNRRISDARAFLESKLNETKDTLLAEMKAMRTDLESQMKLGFAQISADIRELKTALRVHEIV